MTRAYCPHREDSRRFNVYRDTAATIAAHVTTRVRRSRNRMSVAVMPAGDVVIASFGRLQRRIDPVRTRLIGTYSRRTPAELVCADLIPFMPVCRAQRHARGTPPQE